MRGTARCWMLPRPVWKANICAMRQKTAAIVVIGNEILTGKSDDKNASYLIGELYKLGVALRRIVVIADDVAEIAQAVRECAAGFDFVFTSGGVGPTHDDVTIEGVARAFDRAVVRLPELEAMLRSYFGDGVNEARLRMADAPEGSVLIRAEGLRWPVLATDNVFVLPGVPELFRSKFEVSVSVRADLFTQRDLHSRRRVDRITLDRVAPSPGCRDRLYPTSRETIPVRSDRIEVEAAVEPLERRARLLDPSAVAESGRDFQ